MPIRKLTEKGRRRVTVPLRRLANKFRVAGRVGVCRMLLPVLPAGVAQIRHGPAVVVRGRACFLRGWGCVPDGRVPPGGRKSAAGSGFSLSHVMIQPPALHTAATRAEPSLESCPSNKCLLRRVSSLAAKTVRCLVSAKSSHLSVPSPYYTLHP